MNTITKSLLVAVVLVSAGFLSQSAKAYFYQPQSYQPQSYQYNPNYGQASQYQYGYQQDTVSQLVQGQLNFVNNFTYYPSPIRSYFYRNYSPFMSYFGGYGYGYGWGY